MFPLSPKSLGDLLRWQWQRLRAGLPPPPRLATPCQTADLEFIHRNARPQGMTPASTWVGHATTLVQASGLNVLTDPVFFASRFTAAVRWASPSLSARPEHQRVATYRCGRDLAQSFTITWTAIAFARYRGSPEVRRCF